MYWLGWSVNTGTKSRDYRYTPVHICSGYYTPEGSSMSSSLSSVSTSTSTSASFRSYLPSLPIRYELVLPVSHWTRIQPSSPSSPITVPMLGNGPSYVTQRPTNQSIYASRITINQHLQRAKVLGVSRNSALLTCTIK